MTEAQQAAVQAAHDLISELTRDRMFPAEMAGNIAAVQAKLYAALANPEALSDAASCECHRCIREKDLHVMALGLKIPLSATRMILCPQCGNKRCPKASDHRLACTESNEPGQPGSVYAQNLGNGPAQSTFPGTTTQVEAASDCPDKFLKSAPARICLGLFEEGVDDPENAEFPRDHEGIFWAEDAFADLNVRYIRADLVPNKSQPLDDDRRMLLMIEHLGPEALSAGKMTIFTAFNIAVDATEAAHGITAGGKDGQ